MDSKDIIEGNKLIAEFMGMNLVKTQVYDQYEYEWVPAFEHSNWCFETPPPFDKRWNWLMPVVEKIAKTKLTYLNVPEDYYPYPVTFGMLDEEGNFMVRLTCAPLFKSSTLIGATWLVVVDFIKSENNQP